MCCYKQTQTDRGRGGRSFVCVEEVLAREWLEHEGGHDRRRGEPPDEPSEHVAPDQYWAQSTGTGSFSATTPSTAFCVHM